MLLTFLMQISKSEDTISLQLGNKNTVQSENLLCKFFYVFSD